MDQQPTPARAPLSTVRWTTQRSTPRHPIAGPRWLVGAWRSGMQGTPDLTFRTGPNNASVLSRLMARGTLAGPAERLTRHETGAHRGTDRRGVGTGDERCLLAV